MEMRIINDITNFIFIDDEITEKVDAIFLPGGSWPEQPEVAADLWKAGIADLVVPSGGVSIKTGKFNGVKSKQDIYCKEYHTEFDFFADVLKHNGVDEKCIIGENQSGYTGDNAIYSIKLLDEKGICIKKAVICCKNFHARRCLEFYQFAFPNTKFFVKAVPYYENGVTIDRNNWYKTKEGINRALGELGRLGSQFNVAFEILKDSL